MPVPLAKQRKRIDTRCGCSFAIEFTPVNRKEKDDKRVRITLCDGVHSSGCMPSKSQLRVEKRKAGAVTRAINEHQIKAIASVLNTGTKIHPSTLREMIKPLFPPGHPLDHQLIFNVRVKIMKMLKNSTVDIASLAISQNQERELLEENLSPEFFTEAFQQFHELLEESLKDPNELNQMVNCLESLAECDSQFTHRVASSDGGDVTGFVWQTGVMRKDFELFGETLFIDRLGRSLNTKGWPCMTTAMLDGEKRVCLPSEAITIAETVEAHAWKIRMTAEMTPGRNLDDIKVIFADGIVIGETLLERLEIQSSCHLLLDQHHLVSEDLGTWPKFFGLSNWALLKEDLMIMVKTPSETVCNEAFQRLQQKVSHKAEWVDCLNTWIHGKRHMFAHHVVKDIPGNMHRLGNTPAECNHSSIFQRIGSLVLVPASMLGQMINRHADISAERNANLEKHGLLSSAKAQRELNPDLKTAILGLSSWGFEWFEKAHRFRESHRLVDGSIVSLFDPNKPAFAMPAEGPCSCVRKIAIPDAQCGCELLRDGFLLRKWGPRWRQRIGLGTAASAPAAPVAAEEEPMPMDDDASDAGSIAGSVAGSVGESVAGSLASLSQSANAKFGLRDVMDLTRELGFTINRIRNKEQQRLMIGSVLKLTEIGKGNFELVQGKSLEGVLETHLSHFTRNMPSQSNFGNDKENEMMRGSLPDGCTVRKRSANERTMNAVMRNSNKKPLSCSLCFAMDHRAGLRCPVVTAHKAKFIPSKSCKGFADTLQSLSPFGGNS